MEITCPHCSQPRISQVAKFQAIPRSPAVCALCGKESALEQGVKMKALLLVTFLFMLIGPALYAFVYPSLLFMLLTLVPLIAPPFITYFCIPPAPISKAEITYANFAHKLLIVIFFIYLAYAAYDISKNL